MDLKALSAMIAVIVPDSNSPIIITCADSAELELEVLSTRLRLLLFATLSICALLL
jgi:hypothetical protein